LNRDHLLFLLIGLLGGFLAGYLAHEAMAGVQPARVAAGTAAAAPPSMAPNVAPGAAAPAGAAPAGADPMAEVTALREAIERDPNDADAILRLANLSFDIQRWERAGELYARYLELRPGDPDVLTDLGITLRARGEFARALERFREAQSRAENHWQSRYNEVVVLAFDLKDYAAAERALAAIESRNPGNPDVARLAAEVRRLREGAG
jgi:Flp pilus assembly protein TadD